MARCFAGRRSCCSPRSRCTRSSWASRGSPRRSRPLADFRPFSRTRSTASRMGTTSICFAATLAPVGRMALTNYGAQSVDGVLIFYGIGLRTFGRVSLTVGRMCGVLRGAGNREPGVAVAGALRPRRMALADVYLSPSVRAVSLTRRERSALRVCYCTLASRISKTSAAFGLMVPSWFPVAPYASDGGTMMRRIPPTFMPVTPMSKPLMMLVLPTT